jgi:hypothetical protein
MKNSAIHIMIGIVNTDKRVVTANVCPASIEFFLYLMVKRVPMVEVGVAAIIIATILTLSPIGNQIKIRAIIKGMSKSLKNTK